MNSNILIHYFDEPAESCQRHLQSQNLLLQLVQRSSPRKNLQRSGGDWLQTALRQETRGPRPPTRKVTWDAQTPGRAISIP